MRQIRRRAGRQANAEEPSHGAVPSQNLSVRNHTHRVWMVFQRTACFGRDEEESRHSISIGKRLRELRIECGRSQESFAEECGLHRNYVGGIERGERNVALRNLESIAEALGMSVSELTKGL